MNAIQSFEFGDRIYLSGSDRVKEIINKTETLIEESESRLKDSIKELSLEHAKEIKKIIEKETLVIKAKKGKDDRLFGTITNSEISKELKKKYDIDIDRKKIIVENPIKIVGEYIITIKLEQGVIADLKVDIVGE